MADSTKQGAEQFISRGAFKPLCRETISTFKELAVRLARLAEVLRARAVCVLKAESEGDELRQLYKTFREALIHDLSEEEFADMYAQTVACGLLSASISRECGAAAADNLTLTAPETNPLVNELMQTFLAAGGSESCVDFVELGVNEVLSLLRRTRLDEVLKDFGARNPREDPVIHFYELFLKEYDPEKRIKRGVFYTPRAVVRFIVRSVDEILRAEFGLADGLADTTTWREFVKLQKLRNPQSEIRIPKGVSPQESFVQILDPATGTGTFLVEVIDRIYGTMRAKWEREDRSEREMSDLWDDYVPRHLLPRLHGFELMPAPYAIAHMKIGLKLRETHYSFHSRERARIYLTNTLEDSKDFASHSGQTAAKVKRSARVTVIIGNPPYSKLSSNRGRDAEGFVRGYKELAAGERNVQPLSDDYIKFLAFAERALNKVPCGVLAMITNRGYLNGVIHRGLRQSLIRSFQKVFIVDCHGDNNVGETPPAGRANDNLFDIQQGVAISCFVSRPEERDDPKVFHYDLWGTRRGKYQQLSEATIYDESVGPLANVSPPNFFFFPFEETAGEEYEHFYRLTDVFGSGDLRVDRGRRFGNGIKTNRDALLVDFDQAALSKRISALASDEYSDEEIKRRFNLEDGAYWQTGREREKVRAANWKAGIRPCLYRPFDFRWMMYQVNLIQIGRGGASPFVMRHMITSRNLALLTSRNPQTSAFNSALCTRLLSEMKTAESTRASYCFPLYTSGNAERRMSAEDVEGSRVVNLNPVFTKNLAAKLGLVFRPVKTDNVAFDAEDAFHYLYAVLHSPTYRSRYTEFLKTDFPRIPLTSDAELFRKLCALGADLAALHLLEDDYEAASWNRGEGKNPLARPITRFKGSGNAEVAKRYPRYKDGNVYINPTRHFEGVPAEVWAFHVGGYQVCEKWLKDRRARTLSDEDLAHYQRVLIALNETLRLMAETDRAIKLHGGWPLAGSQ